MDATNNVGAFRSVLGAANVPFCAAGVIPISRDAPFKLLFEGPGRGDRGIVNRVTFPLSNADDISPLLEACKQVSFGRGGEEVLDPSYRRALVLPASSFAFAPATAADSYSLGILAKINQTLLSGSTGDIGVKDGDDAENEHVEKRGKERRRIVAHLDKMNVYGVGDSFKGHVDTPRSNQMLGTLLINLPVPHEGGQLVVHAPYPGGGDHEGDPGVAHPSDSGLGRRDSYTTKWGAEDALSWIAFFSDCPHEVSPVEHGNCVMLSYNLLSEEEDDISALTVDTVQERAVQRIVSALRLPGNFGDSQPFVAFHLQYRYPVKLDEDEANAVEASLRGGDALIYRALQAAHAEITFHYMCYDDYDEPIVLGDTSQLLADYYIDHSVRNEFNGQFLSELGVFTALEAPPVKGRYKPKPPTVTRSWYLSYDESYPMTAYTSICMIASAPGHDINRKWRKRKLDYEYK